MPMTVQHTTAIHLIDALGPAFGAFLLGYRLPRLGQRHLVHSRSPSPSAQLSDDLKGGLKEIGHRTTSSQSTGRRPASRHRLHPLYIWIYRFKTSWLGVNPTRV